MKQIRLTKAERQTLQRAIDELITSYGSMDASHCSDTDFEDAAEEKKQLRKLKAKLR